MEANDETLTSAVERLQAARADVPVVETEEALARLESALFGVEPKNRVLDRYTLIRRLGQGASGVVYLAYDPRLDRKVAIKLLNPSLDLQDASEGRARLLREAQTMARSPHPNVAAVYDVGTYAEADQNEAGVFLVMEYVEGPDLARWLDGRHSWTKVLDVFIDAGRGLAAAHGVGVTHRDFKPANAIVAHDGRVRVLDFGLARGLEHGEEPTLRIHPGALEQTVAAAGPLTVDGTVLGTPVYMAPEQHEGLPADAASDQYSFCVALWEGLYGERPFGGRSLSELAEKKSCGPPPIPEGSSVPHWVGRVLVRGLDPDSRQRWPSMQALLSALQAGFARRRRRRTTVLVAAVTGPAVLGGWILTRDEGQCTGASERYGAVWNGERRAEITAAFAATEIPYAAATADRVDARIDDFGQRWMQEHREACEATNVLGEQSVELMDLRMACLDRQMREVDAVVTVFEDADETTVERAVDAVGSLPDPGRCGDVDALLAQVAPPSDPSVAAQVEAQRAELARALALERAGRVPEALEVAQTVADRATQIEYPPLLAEALNLRGSLEDKDGRYEDAIETLTRAHAVALSCGHDGQAARAAQWLVFLHGDRQSQLEPALRWAQISEAEHERAKQEDRSALLVSKAAAYREAGRYEDARRYAVEAIELLERLSGPDEPRLAMYHNNLGYILNELGRADEARAHLEKVHEMWLQLYGPEHPKIALSIINLGNADLLAGDNAQAEQRFRTVVEIREQAFGPDHPEVAMALGNLGVALRRSGELDEAHDVTTRALKILERRLGPDDVRLGNVIQGLAFIESERGHEEAALRHIERAIALWESGYSADHPAVATGLYNKAVALATLGDLPQARAAFDRSVAIKKKTFGDGDAHVAETRRGFAVALREAGREAEAAALVKLALQELAVDADPAVREALREWSAGGD